MSLILSLFKREWIIRCFIIAAVTISFTLFCVSTSEKIGRLSTVPNYDDCVYMVGAEFRNFMWQEGGWPALWKSLWERPFHSPYSECLAMIAFALFGHNDRAPYLANAVVILAYLGCLHMAITWNAISSLVSEFVYIFESTHYKNGRSRISPRYFLGRLHWMGGNICINCS